MTQRLTLPILTARLLLRDFQEEDYAAIYAYASDPDVTRYVFYGPRDEADTRAYLHRILQSQQETPRLTWELAVVARDQGRLIGACDLTLETEGEADLGYILEQDAWGQGYATEATSALVAVGFRELKVARIFALCEVNNLASAHVLEKAGLRRKGILERYREAKGRWWDMSLYEILRREWEATG